jgi:hypothetical protein
MQVVRGLSQTLFEHPPAFRLRNENVPSQSVLRDRSDGLIRPSHCSLYYRTPVMPITDSESRLGV